MPDSIRTGNERLGYPADARLLIINADDFGMCHAINEAALRTIRGGVATSCTLMVPCPWADHAMHLLRQNPDIPFGVHLTAVAENAYYRWGPVVPQGSVSTLLDEHGYFYREERIPEFLQQVDLGELEREWRAQIERPLDAGLRPTHVDSHCAIHTRREDLFDMTVRLAREYRLALRVGVEAFAEKPRRQGFVTSDHGTLDSYGLKTEDKPTLYPKLLRELPPGLSEWAVHPGIANQELKAISPSWPVRQADLAFFTSQEARDILEEQAITLISYRQVQSQIFGG